MFFDVPKPVQNAFHACSGASTGCICTCKRNAYAVICQIDDSSGLIFQANQKLCVRKREAFCYHIRIASEPGICSIIVRNQKILVGSDNGSRGKSHDRHLLSAAVHGREDPSADIRIGIGVELHPFVGSAQVTPRPEEFIDEDRGECFAGKRKEKNAKDCSPEKCPHTAPAKRFRAPTMRGSASSKKQGICFLALDRQKIGSNDQKNILD